MDLRIHRPRPSTGAMKETNKELRGREKAGGVTDSPFSDWVFREGVLEEVTL